MKISKTDACNFIRKYQNALMAVLVLLVVLFCIGLRFDYYFDLNDDTLIKDILSGAYTGKPEGRNIQMLFPVSFFISIFYFGIKSVDWFGLFLCGCQYLCFFLILKRSVTYGKSWKSKIGILLLGTSLFLLFFLQPLVIVQYTITAGLMGGTAAFLLYTTEDNLNWKLFLKQNVISILLVIVGFYIRTEMMLLLFPLICLTGMFKWANEKKIITLENIKKYGITIGSILLGMVMGLLLHQIAYGSAEWKQFQSLFDSRTQLYDFAIPPAYEAHQEFYEEIGLAKSQQQLLVNYNYGIDETIDETVMEEVAIYAKGLAKEEFPVKERLKKSILDYKYRFLHFQFEDTYRTDYPYNLCVVILYAGLILIAACNRRWSYLWRIPLLLLIRSGLWIYIVYGLRTPPRITIPLYAMEALMLSGMLLEELKRNQYKKWFGLCYGVILSILVISAWKPMETLLTEEYERREVVNAEYESFKDYVKKHPNKFYFLDVFSTVAYSEKMFVNVDNTLTNYDIMGGWACKSPIYEEKMQQFSIDSVKEALYQDGNVYIITKEERDLLWLQEFYRDKGIAIEVLHVNSIADSPLGIYQLFEIQN